MREIKFRAWDAEREQMFTHPKWVEFRAKHGVITAHNYNRASNVQTLELMQFTGLTDKNGIEVYEGDIMELFSDGEQYSAKVCFDVDRFFNGWNINPHHIEEGSTVIGNIHENPELLEAKS